MTPLTWLTIFYQAACRQYHMHCVDSRRRRDVVSGSDNCVLWRDSGNASEEVENVSESPSGQSSSAATRNANCSCPECFLHVPQYTQQAYLQIVRVRFPLFCSISSHLH